MIFSNHSKQSPGVPGAFSCLAFELASLFLARNGRTRRSAELVL